MGLGSYMGLKDYFALMRSTVSEWLSLHEHTIFFQTMNHLHYSVLHFSCLVSLCSAHWFEGHRWRKMSSRLLISKKACSTLITHFILKLIVFQEKCLVAPSPLNLARRGDVCLVIKLSNEPSTGDYSPNLKLERDFQKMFLFKTFDIYQ